MPTLPEGNIEALECLAHPNDPSKATSTAPSEELLLLFTKTKETVHKLLEVEDKPWIWDVSLVFEAWHEQEQSALSAYSLPPMKYQVRIEASAPHAASWSCLLTPAELRVITMIHADLGRRIGDELDGRRPALGE